MNPFALGALTSIGITLVLSPALYTISKKIGYGATVCTIQKEKFNGSR
jgi:hypothetical protein